MEAPEAVKPIYPPGAPPQVKASEGFRWKTGFTWQAVDPGLLRQLLSAAAIDQRTPDGLDEVADDQLFVAAQAAFGPLLPERAMNRVGKTLQAAWLPHADDESLEHLVNMSWSALGLTFKRPATRKARVEFLLDRRARVCCRDR